MYSGKGDLQQAERAYRMSLDLDGRFVMDWYRLAHTLRLQGRYEEARQAVLRVLEIDPGDASAHYEAGAISQLMGDQTAARKYLRTAVAVLEPQLTQNPSDGERHLEKAAAHARLGEVGLAAAVARRAVQLTQDLPVERAGLLVLLGQPDEAVAVLERAVEAGYRNLMWIPLNTDLQPLSGHPRFEALLTKLQQAGRG